MKIKTGFCVRHVADAYLAVPVGSRTWEVPGVISLSETGAFLWRMLEKGADISTMTEGLLSEYEVTRDRAEADVRAFVGSLRDQGWLSDDA